MHYRTLTPTLSALRSAIVSFGEMTGNEAISKMICPRTGPALVICLDGHYSIDDVPAPDLAIMGIRTHPVRMEAAPQRTRRILVRFTPCGLSAFWKSNAASLADCVVPAEQIFPEIPLQALRRALVTAERLEEAVPALEEFFSDLYTPRGPMDDAIARAADRICCEPDAASVILARDVPASRRHAERLFARLIGVSPRSFARIARFDRAAGMILDGSSSMTDVGLSSGYYDQAHFGHEFRRLASMPPSAFTACPRPAPARGSARRPAQPVVL